MDLGQYEIMDRTYVIIDNIESHLINSHAVTPEQRILLEKAQSLLMEVYQNSGLLWHNSCVKLG